MSGLFFMLFLLNYALRFRFYAHGWRILHEPFVPVAQSPPWPSPPTAAAEPPTAPFPKYPFSSDSQPFFPKTPSQPSPPISVSSQPTFPANISSLIFPNSYSPPSLHTSPAGKVVTAVLCSLLALALLSLSLAYFLHRHRCCRGGQSNSSEKARFFPDNYCSSSDAADAADAGGRNPLAVRTASDFLFVDISGSRLSGGDSPTRGGSPELRPLPPLSRQLRQNHGNAEGRCSSEEFYSPRSSSAGRDSTSRKEFMSAALEKFWWRSETLSATSKQHSSNSVSRSSLAASSPPLSSPPLRRSTENATASWASSRSTNWAFMNIKFLQPEAAPPPSSQISSPHKNNSANNSSQEKDSPAPCSSAAILQSSLRIGEHPAGHRSL